MIQSTPNVSAASGLTDVSCPSPPTSAGPSPRWSDGRWRLRVTPDPPEVSYLYGVSCSSRRACTATGTYVTLANVGKVLVERWNGRIWRRQATPATGRVGYELLAVSCPSASDCTAVGSDLPLRHRGGALVEHWDGKRWSIQSTPEVKGHTAPQLNGISCLAPARCAAVGYYLAIPGDSQEKTLAERHGS